MNASSRLRVVTAGSIDDGKSTLIGRLLHDSGTVLADQLAATEAASRRRGADAADLALLVDGLRAEREQGITIDVAYRHLRTARRAILLADTPGHVQYTRNTVTGASTADVALVLVDARTGVVEQTRRHAAIMALLGVGHVVLVVNKMDLVGYAEDAYDLVARDFAELVDRTRVAVAGGTAGIRSWVAIPVCALTGDNVVTRSVAMPWYAGPALLEHLESAEPAAVPADRVRFPVQLAVRPRGGPHTGYRGYAGRVAAGVLRTGAEVTVQPGGDRSTVTAIETYDGPLAEAGPGRSVVVRLADHVDVARGDLLTGGTPAVLARDVDTAVCLLGDAGLRPGERYRIRHTTRDIPGMVAAVRRRLDVAALTATGTDVLDRGDLGEVTLRLAEPLAVDRYRDCRATGALLLVDPATGATVAAAMITAAV